MSDFDSTQMIDRGEPDDYVRLDAHPRAQRSIARAKAIGGVVGFLVGLWLGSRAGLPSWDTGVRALAGGIAGWLIVWVAAVQIWKQLVIAEFRAAEQQREQARKTRQMYADEIAKQRREQREAAQQGLGG
jgi:uncharacterized membrane protein